MRTYRLFMVLRSSEIRLLQTTDLAAFVQAMQAIPFNGNVTIQYKAAAAPFETIQGFRVEIQDP